MRQPLFLRWRGWCARLSCLDPTPKKEVGSGDEMDVHGHEAASQLMSMAVYACVDMYSYKVWTLEAW